MAKGRVALRKQSRKAGREVRLSAPAGAAKGQSRYYFSLLVLFKDGRVMELYIQKEDVSDEYDVSG